MRERLSRRATLESLIAVSLGVHAGTAGARSGRGRGHGETKPTLNRFATTVAGAEFTGIFLTDDGRLFFNVQHPGAEAHGRYRPGAIGAVTGVDMTRLPPTSRAYSRRNHSPSTSRPRTARTKFSRRAATRQ